MNESKRTTSVVIVTALPLEHDAVREHLSDLQKERHPDGSVYEIGAFNSGKSEIIVGLVQVGMGNTGASAETERALIHFRPDYALFVGIGGGLKDADRGDVVIANKVYYFEFGKDGDEFKSRPDVHKPSYTLLQSAIDVGRTSDWKNRIIGIGGELDPGIFFGAIAAGEKVIVSESSPSYELIKSNFSDALAVDMEGFGFLAAGYRHESVKCLVIRGISDTIANKTAREDLVFQPKAAKHAAAFAFEILEQLNVQRIRGNDPKMETEDQGGILEIAAQLYPEGPGQKNIWKRAGGNLSKIKLGNGGYADWYEAIEQLHLGGGGENIELLSLVRQMLNDYPNNTALRKLF